MALSVEDSHDAAGSTSTEDHSALSNEEADEMIGKSQNRRYGFHSMGALDVIKEGVLALREHSSLFSWTTIFLGIPFSAVVLCQVWIVGPFVESVAGYIETAAHAQGLWFSPSYRMFCWKLSDNLISHAFQFPFYVMLSIPARACLTWAVALMYSGKKFMLLSFIDGLPRIWLRGFVTYLWICFVMSGSITFIVTIFIAVTSIFTAAKLSVDILFLILAAIGLAFSLFFAHLVIICNTAMTMSMLDEIQGRLALMKAILLLRGRTQVGLLIFIISTAATASIDSLFQYRVVGMPGYRYEIDIVSKMWEMPLLISMYAFLYLFDAIATTIFFFTCKASCCESFDRYELEEEHLT